MLAMCAVSREFSAILTEPTVRTLRLLSCPPRLLVPSAQLPSQQTFGTRGDLRQNAVRVIAVGPPIAPVRTRGLAADSLRKSGRNFAIDLRNPRCLRAFAIAIV